jgi:hypothetical protein
VEKTDIPCHCQISTFFNLANHSHTMSVSCFSINTFVNHACTRQMPVTHSQQFTVSSTHTNIIINKGHNYFLILFIIRLLFVTYFSSLPPFCTANDMTKFGSVFVCTIILSPHISPFVHTALTFSTELNFPRIQ